MQKLPLYNAVAHINEKYPIRVSTQAVRDRDFAHFHRIVQVCYVMSGELKHTINGKEYIQRRGSCAFILPFSSHILDAIDSEDTPIIVYVWFHESFLTERGYSFSSYGEGKHFEGRKIPVVCEFSGGAEAATELIRGMISEFDRGKDIALDKMAEMLTSLLRLACTEKQEARNSSLLPQQLGGINRAITYMEKNYADKISLDELARVAVMSRRSFSAHFKKITGLSAAHFLITIRLSHAAGLLNSDMLYDEIARRCGLNEHTNLARVFVKYLGLTPTDFREIRRHYLYAPHQVSTSERYKWLFEE